ncbi:hypothetical protein Bca101_060004 [Brassica carinata]
MDGDETKDPVMGSEDGGRGLETVVEEVLTPVADGGGDAEVAGGGGVGSNLDSLSVIGHPINRLTAKRTTTCDLRLNRATAERTTPYKL